MEVRAKVGGLGSGTKTAEGAPKKALPSAKKPTEAPKKKKRKARKAKGDKAQDSAKSSNPGKRKGKRKKGNAQESKALVLWDPKTEITTRDPWFKRILKHVGGLKGATTIGGTALVIGVGWKVVGGVIKGQAVRAAIPVLVGLPALAARNKTVARIGGTAAALGIFALALDTYHRFSSDEPAVADATPKKNGSPNGGGNGTAGGNKPGQNGESQA